MRVACVARSLPACSWKGPWRHDGTRELVVSLKADDHVGIHGASLRLTLGHSIRQVMVPIRWTVTSRTDLGRSESISVPWSVVVS
jgi:hypothetical protein